MKKHFQVVNLKLSLSERENKNLNPYKHRKLTTAAKFIKTHPKSGAAGRTQWEGRTLALYWSECGDWDKDTREKRLVLFSDSP